ncbi:MAG: pilus assembly protein [Candidatus Ancillula sp.]|jgi:Flp pilus assembly protein TadG|nr:pilus assembly protein [Candidatus Ancillula sp.]
MVKTKLAQAKLLEDDTGSVTVEFALCLPVVLFFIGLIVMVANYSLATAKCQQVAKELVREAIMRQGSEEDVNEVYEIIATDFSQSIDNVDYSVQYHDAWVDVTAQYNDPQSPFGFIINEARAKMHARIEK